MTNDLTNPGQDQKQRPWLVWLALGIFVLGLFVRLTHPRELSADVAYELEAAYRTLLGQCPYVDFYFDQVMPVIVWRMLALVIAPAVAFISGRPCALTDCFLNLSVLGMASVLTACALSIFSFTLCWWLMDRYGRNVFAGHIKWLILLALAMVNLAMGFEYGGQQHLFLLFFLPYFLARWLALQGAVVPAKFKILTALLCALGASFSLLFVFAVLAFEILEALARNTFKTLLALSFVVFVAASALIWLNLLFLPKAASAVFFGLVLPLKLNALTHDNFSFYGYATTPERKPLFYAAVLALIFSFGALSRIQLLRPLASMTVLGLFIWMTLVLGLSSDALVLTCFTTMLLTIEGYFAVQWITAKYPRLFWRKKERAFVALVLSASLTASAFLVGCEIYQRKLVKTAPTRLKSLFNADCQDLATVISENSKLHGHVLILNGRLRPATPVLRMLGCSPFGYFIGSDVLGTLANIRVRHYFEPDLDTSEPTTQLLEKSLYDRLRSDIIAGKPELIVVQGGEMEDSLKRFDLDSLIRKRYNRLCEAQYYTDHVGLRELSEGNYNYWVYKLQDSQANLQPPGKKP